MIKLILNIIFLISLLVIYFINKYDFLSLFTYGSWRPLDRSEGRDPNGICYPCVMGWGLAGPGNSSAVAAAVVAAAPLKCLFPRNTLF